MGIQDGTCEFALSKGVNYKFQGSTVTAKMVTLKEPGMDHIKFYLKLKQMITRSQMELAKQAGEINKMRDSIGEIVKPLNEDVERIENETDDIHEVISLALQASETVDIGNFIETFEKMACLNGRKSICILDGHQSMTSVIWSNLKPDDAFNMAVRWCSFFGMPSEGGAKITSGQPSELPMERMEV
jgi:uncharacterized membrane protein